MKRYLPLLLGFLILGFTDVTIGAELADAAPLEVGAYSSVAKVETGESIVPDATHSVECIWTLQSITEEAAQSQSSVHLHVGGVLVGNAYLENTRVEHQEASISALVGAGQSYELEVGEKGEIAAYVSCAVIEAGGGGGEGKEGKEGPPGKEGKEGKEGPEGKEGMKGISGEGEGGGGKVELVSFGGEAQSTLSEMKDTDELLGWCVIGTLLALALGFMVYKILGPGRR